MVNIAVIDDNLLVLKGLVSYLSEEPDFQVVGAYEKGEKALEEIKTLEPDIVVLDPYMSDINGLHLMREIKKILGEKGRIIVFSSYDSEEVMRIVYDIGISAFVLKSASMHHLINAIKQSYLGNILISERFFRNRGNECLTNTEIKILQLISQEKTNNEIAEELNISKRTVEYHISSIIQKLGVDSRVGAVVKGIQKGILLYNLV
ncbi:MAG TPA: DNA-binding response regulator [Paenibacillaceae bacterium]|nr:DNA-binding response regulator [Paenibacillaceae bacterium]